MILSYPGFIQKKHQEILNARSYSDEAISKRTGSGYQRFFYSALLTILIVLMLSIKPAVASVVEVSIKGTGENIEAEFRVRGKILGKLPRAGDDELFNRRIENWTIRLEEIFTAGTDPRKIKAVYISGMGVVFNGKDQVLSFDRKTAEAAGTTPIKMARQWASNVRFALKNAPGFTLKTNSAIIPLGEKFSVEFEGKFRGPVRFENYNSNLVKVWADRSAGKIYLEGLQTGSGSVNVQAEDISRILHFKVKRRAANLLEYMTLEVSGNPATANLVQEAFESVIWYRSKPRDGAFMVVDMPIKSEKFPAVKPGQSRQMIVPVKIDGPEYIPSIQKVNLTVDNINYSWPSPKLVFVSNKPEVITQDSELFDGIVKKGEPIRYFYHHKNAHGQPWRNFYVALENQSNSPVKVFVSPVGAGPSSDELFAGHLAATGFFRARRLKKGWTVVVKPGTRYVIEKKLLKTDHTISGVGYVNIIYGTHLKFTCYSTTIPGKHSPADVREYVRNDNARTSRGVFPAFIDLKPVHEIGGKYEYLYLGGEPYLEDVRNGSPNYGNYGAFYRINLLIKNPRDQQEEAQIYFVPGGGLARGIFVVDDKLVETPLVSSAQRVLLKKVKIPPGGKQRVNITTMPQGGSYYPVKIVVESDYLKIDRQSEVE